MDRPRPVLAWLARYATRVAVRRVVTLLVLALLAWVGIGRAHAQEHPDCSDQTKPTATCPDRGSAYAGALAYVNWMLPNYSNGVICGPFVREDPYREVKYWVGNRDCENPPYVQSARYWPKQECPTGTNWDADSKTCTTECGSDGWPDPERPGQCLNAGKCLDRASLGNTIIGSYASSICMAGCEFGPPGGGVPSGTMLGDGSVLTFGGGWAPTGNSCADVPPDIPPPSEEEACTTQPGNGMTICVKPDGRHCYSAKTPGRQICWNPAETGEKTDGPTKQVRNAGESPIPPNLALPSGDTLEQGPSSTTQTTINNNTSTTTTTNYYTQHGTDAGPPQGSNQGEDGDGGDGEGEGDGDGPDISGGSECRQPPQSSDATAWQTHVVNQLWLERCQGLDGLNPEVDEARAMVEALEAQWSSWTGTYEGDALDEFHATVAETPESVIEKGELSLSDLDSSGFLGAGQCPSIPSLSVGSTSLEFSFGPLCDLMLYLGYMVEALAYIIAIRILTS